MNNLLKPQEKKRLNVKGNKFLNGKILNVFISPLDFMAQQIIYSLVFSNDARKDY